jgi:hypothetical protein
MLKQFCRFTKPEKAPLSFKKPRLDLILELANPLHTLRVDLFEIHYKD